MREQYETVSKSRCHFRMKTESCDMKSYIHRGRKKGKR